MKPRSFFSIVAAGVLVLLLIGAGGFYWLTANSPLALLGGGVSASPAAAMFVPSGAPAMVSLLVNPDRLKALTELLASPSQRRLTGAELDEFKQNLLGLAGLDYNKDVQPWLGEEITAACTSADIDRNSENGMQPGYLLALSTRDGSRSREFLQLFWGNKASAGKDLVFEPYRGVTLIYSSAGTTAAPETGVPPVEPAHSLATAVVADQFVLFANHPKVLRDAINNVAAPNLNLSSSSSYQLALNRLDQARIGVAFLNLSQLAALTGNRLEENPSPVTSSESPNLALAAGLNRQGLLAHTAVLIPEMPAPAAPGLSEPVGALQYAPESVAVLAAGSDLRGLWDQLDASLSGQGLLKQPLSESLTALGNRWGIDLARDIFEGVRGEYALGLLPSQADGTSDWIFVAQQSPELAKSVERLDGIARSQGLSAGALTLGSRQVTAWTKLSASDAGGQKSSPPQLVAQVVGVRALAGNYEIFASSIGAMEQALSAAKGGSALAALPFLEAISALPRPNYGYAYLDWSATQPILERRLPLLGLVQRSGAFKHLRGIGVSSAGGDKGVLTADLFIRLRS
ncbi:DUF3352 domain-containing protein [Kamptonema formosum]|uniref:DUF3352 domain-containing protein n=1 Tax=Kamptonema formosum TaxID=331992 RepID=UPI0003473937|nr:DUF3352 domain-containing protein [Oscillatoria sp. PCC 10802]